MELLTVPDGRLQLRSEPVKEINQTVKDLIDELWVWCGRKPSGYNVAALAAPQLGVLLRVVVINGQGLGLTLINPELVYAKGGHQVIEDCLSIPGRSFRVTRPKIVKVRYLDLDGQMRTIKGRDFTAQVLMHELDHLDGVLIDTKGRMF